MVSPAAMVVSYPGDLHGPSDLQETVERIGGDPDHTIDVRVLGLQRIEAKRVLRGGREVRRPVGIRELPGIVAEEVVLERVRRLDIRQPVLQVQLVDIVELAFRQPSVRERHDAVRADESARRPELRRVLREHQVSLLATPAKDLGDDLVVSRVLGEDRAIAVDGSSHQGLRITDLPDDPVRHRCELLLGRCQQAGDVVDDLGGRRHQLDEVPQRRIPGRLRGAGPDREVSITQRHGVVTGSDEVIRGADHGIGTSDLVPEHRDPASDIHERVMGQGVPHGGQRGVQCLHVTGAGARAAGRRSRSSWTSTSDLSCWAAALALADIVQQRPVSKTKQRGGCRGDDERHGQHADEHPWPAAVPSATPADPHGPLIGRWSGRLWGIWRPALGWRPGGPGRRHPTRCPAIRRDSTGVAHNG